MTAEKTEKTEKTEKNMKPDITALCRPQKSGRLDHLLRGWGLATKQEVHDLARQGRIEINNHPCLEGGHICTDGDTIRIDGVLATPRPCLTVMLNKPAGYVCMGGDPRYPAVNALLPESGPEHTLFPVGRLDANTEGLLIMTNSGDLSQAIAEPAFSITKTYLVSLGRPLCADAEERMEAGITFISGEQYRPAKLIRLDDEHALVQVTEGKYHEVKRLIRGCQSFVKELRRVAIGRLPLDFGLSSGAYRTLDAKDIEKIFMEPDEGFLQELIQELS